MSTLRLISTAASRSEEMISASFTGLRDRKRERERERERERCAHFHTLHSYFRNVIFNRFVFREVKPRMTLPESRYVYALIEETQEITSAIACAYIIIGRHPRQATWKFQQYRMFARHSAFYF